MISSEEVFNTTREVCRIFKGIMSTEEICEFMCQFADEMEELIAIDVEKGREEIARTFSP